MNQNKKLRGGSRQITLAQENPLDIIGPLSLYDFKTKTNEHVRRKTDLFNICFFFVHCLYKQKLCVLFSLRQNRASFLYAQLFITSTDITWISQVCLFCSITFTMQRKFVRFFPPPPPVLIYSIFYFQI